MSPGSALKPPRQEAQALNPKRAQSPQHSERRRHNRRAYSGHVHILGFLDTETAALDLSTSGVGLLSARLLSVGQVVNLSFLGGSVQIAGVVQRVRPVYTCDWHVGIAFANEQPELADVVEALH